MNSGSGVFATRFIEKNEFITIYTGEFISSKEGEERLSGVGPGYLFFIENYW